MPQPTGPHPEDEPESEPPVRAAAGRDITFETSRLRQAGHATSASSDLRMMSSSKVFAQAVQAYS